MTIKNIFVVFAAAAAAVANAQGQGWRRVDEPRTDRVVLRAAAQEPAPAAERPAARAPQTTTPPARNRSRMTTDDLERQMERIADLTPVTVGKPAPFEESRGYYQGYYGFQGMNLPGSIYPQYSSLQPAKELPLYLQQELFEEFQRSGEFNPLIPGTGHMSQHLDVLVAEAKTGRGRYVLEGGRRVEIGQGTWTTTKYVVVSSVGILEETVQGFQIRGDDLARITDSIPGIGSRGRRVIWDTLGRSQRSAVDRQIVGVLYVAVVDLENRSVLKSSTGVAAMGYTEFASTDVPAIRMQSVRYAGAGKFARELVMSALHDEVDRDGSSVERFLQRRRGALRRR